MRSGIAAIAEVSRNRLLKTVPRPALHGMVRGIPMMVRGNTLMVGASGGIGGTGILSNIYGEMEEIDAEMARFHGEFKNQVPTDSFTIVQNTIFIKPEYLTNSKVRFFALVWTPFVLQWKAYRDSQHKFLKTVANILSIWITTGVWDELQEWRKKLGAMVEKAKESEVVSVGPEPRSPRTNIVEDIADAAKAPVNAIWKMIKIVFYAAIGIVAIIVIAYAVKTMRGPHTVISP